MTGGFTLIELMVVVVILGIVATIGANLIGARDKAFLAVMKADLRNLASMQTNYAVDNYTYANSLIDLETVSSEGSRSGFSGRPPASAHGPPTSGCRTPAVPSFSER